MNEVAFTVMDLRTAAAPTSPAASSTRISKHCGDYAGIAVLRYYLAYRAMVRAKVACLRAAQLRRTRHAGPSGEFRDYRAPRPPPMPVRRAPAVIVNHGLAGCGKTTLSQALLERTGAVRIRTDVERKRLRGLGARESSAFRHRGDLYARGDDPHHLSPGRRPRARGRRRRPDCDRRCDLSQAVATRSVSRPRGGTSRAVRHLRHRRARVATLRERVLRRARLGTDASEAGLAVLDHQLRTDEPLAADERADVVVHDSERPLEDADRSETWRALRERLDADAPGDAAVRPPRAGAVRAPALPRKLAFLRRPASYAEPHHAVDAVETHLSWVFLTDGMSTSSRSRRATAHATSATSTARTATARGAAPQPAARAPRLSRACR